VGLQVRQVVGLHHRGKIVIQLGPINARLRAARAFAVSFEPAPSNTSWYVVGTNVAPRPLAAGWILVLVHYVVQFLDVGQGLWESWMAVLSLNFLVSLDRIELVLTHAQRSER